MSDSKEEIKRKNNEFADELLERLEKGDYDDPQEVVKQSDLNALHARNFFKVNAAMVKASTRRQKEKKAYKKRSLILRVIVGACSLPWIGASIPLIFSFVGLPFGVIGLVVGGYSLMWALEIDTKVGAEIKKERSNQGNGEQQSRS